MKRPLLFTLILLFFLTDSHAQFSMFPPARIENSKIENSGISNDLFNSQPFQILTANQIKVFPNPATNLLWIQVSPTKYSLLKLTMYDINERKLLEKEYSLEPGTQKLELTLPAYDIASSLYVKIEMSGIQVPEMVRILRQM